MNHVSKAERGKSKNGLADAFRRKEKTQGYEATGEESNRTNKMRKLEKQLLVELDTGVLGFPDEVKSSDGTALMPTDGGRGARVLER